MRHLHIHKNQVIRCGLHPLNGLAAVLRQINNKAHVFQQGLRNLAVDRLVFHQQNALAAKLLPDGAFRLLSADSGRFVDRGRVLAQHGSEPERAALALHAGHPRLAAHELRNLFGDGKAKARAAVFAAHGVIRLFKGAEKARLHLRADANACVFHFKAVRYGAVSLRFRAHCHLNIAVIRKFERIGGEVEQGLLQAAVVAIDGAGLWRGIHNQLKAFFLRFLAQNGRDVLKQGRNMYGHMLQHEFSGFNL